MLPRLYDVIYKQVGGAAYLFGYATRANELKNGEDPFYLNLQSTQSRVLGVLSEIVDALPGPEAQRMEVERKAQYASGEWVAMQVINHGTAKQFETGEVTPQ